MIHSLALCFDVLTDLRSRKFPMPQEKMHAFLNVRNLKNVRWLILAAKIHQIDGRLIGADVKMTERQVSLNQNVG